MRGKTILLVAFVLLSWGTSSANGQSEGQNDKPNQSVSKNERSRGFRLSRLTESLPADVKQVIVAYLAERFGTPTEPVVWNGLPVDFGEANKTNGQELGWKLRLGRDIYMAKCARCHGAGGDGRGAEAKDLEPGPRDFRRGIFKWTSTKHKMSPLRHDVRETIRLGVSGTAMPAFPGLAEDQVAALVEYVRWLTMCGQVERGLAIDFLDWQYSAKELRSKLPEYTKELPESFSYFWLKAERESSIIRPRIVVTARIAVVLFAELWLYRFWG